MNQNDQTLALHAGHNASETGGTRAVPIQQSTAYEFNDSDHAANLFALAETGNIYTRINNPTNDILEQRIADIEGGIAAVATASGTSALATTFLTLLKYPQNYIFQKKYNAKKKVGWSHPDPQN